ncbi:MAG TPA: glycosyltransferase [Crinalium sp.]|jgi:glycosyltransferase involved in cell wall biosynthesis
MSAAFGVNIAGYVKGEFGLGESVRANLRALKAADIPFVINNVSSDPWNCHRYLDSTYGDSHFSQDNPYPINLVNLNAEHVPLMVKRFGSDYFKNHYNIGFWVWELPQFPTEWQWLFGFFDEIWTPSNYAAEAIAAVSPIPVIKVMHSLDLPQPSISREALGLPTDKFIYLFMFDALSTFERKNPVAVVEAFIQAFGKVDPNVMLVIKFSNSEHYPQQRDQFKALVADCPSIYLIEGHLMKEEVNALIYNCDCYVSLHRAEGFGLTMAEAMYYGKPVIATGYSANLEFMNVGNSFLVKYDLISTSADEGPYKKGNFWANPDVEHASALMHYIFHNYSQAQQIGIRAAREVRPLLSPPRIGDRIRNRLNYILDKQISTESKEHLPVKNSTTELQLQAWKRTAQQLQLELVKMQSGASNS